MKTRKRSWGKRAEGQAEREVAEIMAASLPGQSNLLTEQASDRALERKGSDICYSVVLPAPETSAVCSVG